jgi:PAS domain-containing protein
MRMPALAVVGADHQIIRSTETFRRKCEDAASLCGRAPELDLVLSGQTNSAVVNLGELSVAIEAVTDAIGRRQAMLSLPGEDLEADPESPLTALREAADESPAIVWVKDLEGRYLYANPRYERDLGTSVEQLRGNTDADLPLVETVDGPRLRYAEDGLQEPLQLEYTVPAFEKRPPMAALRFPLRNGSGRPVGTCGVAAPKSEAQVARDEAVRLMQLERWNRLDPNDVRAEVLEQWHVQATPGPVPEPSRESQAGIAPDTRSADEEPQSPESADGGVPAANVEMHEAAPVREAPAPLSDVESSAASASYQREEEWVRHLRQAASVVSRDDVAETAGALQTDLQLARRWAERADQLQGDLHEANARAQKAESEAQRASALARRASDETSRYRNELEQLRAELERERAEGQAARSEVEAARRELGAARAQTESLRGPADAALRLSEELGRALAAERDRGDELARTLARVRSRLGDLEGALERTQTASAHAA